MLGQTLRMAFWVTYDHLGKLVLINLLCVPFVLGPFLLGFTALLAEDWGTRAVLGTPFLVIALGVTGPLACAGLAHLVKILIDQRDGALSDFFAGLRVYGRRAVALGLLAVFAAVCLGTSVWFYATVVGETVPWLGLALSALALWCLLLALLMSPLVFPTLVQKKAGVRETLKLTALLVLDNPLFAVGLAVQLVALAAVSIVVAPVCLFLSGAAAMALCTCAYEQLARKYALLELNRSGFESKEESVPLEGFANGVRAISRQGRWELDDTEDDYLNRGLRDAIFPWKG